MKRKAVRLVLWLNWPVRLPLPDRLLNWACRNINGVSPEWRRDYGRDRK